MKLELAIIRNEENRLFIAIPACCIHPTVLIIDSVRHYRFSETPYTYITLADAIAWHENELQFIQNKKRKAKKQDLINDMIKIRDRPQPDTSAN